MLDGSRANGDVANIGNFENNNPIPGSKTKQAKRKPLLHHQKPPRNCPNIRLSDHNNNILTASSVHSGTPVSNQAVLNLHHVKPGAKKEVLKSKSGRSERGAVQPGVPPTRHLPRHDHIHNVNARSHKPKQTSTGSPSTKRNDNRSLKKSPSSHLPQPGEQKKPLQTSNNMKIHNHPPAEAAPENLRDGEKVYAGAKFSEPPSPSVLPKPPSHWMGEDESLQRHQSREQMTVHLKSLLKVQA